MINKELRKQGKTKTIGNSSICKYLKKRNIKLRKFKRVFGLNEAQKKKDWNIAKQFKKKKSKEKIFFLQMKQR